MTDDDIRLALRDIITVLKDMRIQAGPYEMQRELRAAYDIVSRMNSDFVGDYWQHDAREWLKRNKRYGD